MRHDWHGMTPGLLHGEDPDSEPLALVFMVCKVCGLKLFSSPNLCHLADELSCLGNSDDLRRLADKAT